MAGVTIPSILFESQTTAVMAERSSTTTGGGSKGSNDVTTKPLQAAQFSTDALWDPAWQESEGEATIRQRSNDDSARTFYCGWFCPYAQRVWIALEELGLDYKYVEVNPYCVDPSQPGGYTKDKQSIQKKRETLPEFVAVSPYGLVPSIVEADGATICDSAVCLEYLHQVYSHKVDNNKDEIFKGKIFPDNPLAASWVRLIMEHSKRIMSAHFTLMTEPSDEKRREAHHQLLQDAQLLAFAMVPDLKLDQPLLEAARTAEHPTVDVASWMAMATRVHTLSKSTQSSDRPSDVSGPFILGDQFTAADISLGTFWMRVMWLDTHYRHFQMPVNDPATHRLDRWWKAVQQRPSFRKTMICRERLIACDLAYARRGAGNDSGITPLKDYAVVGTSPAFKRAKVETQ